MSNVTGLILALPPSAMPSMAEPQMLGGPAKPEINGKIH